MRGESCGASANEYSCAQGAQIYFGVLGGCLASANEHSCAQGAQIYFGDLTSYLTYRFRCVEVHVITSSDGLRCLHVRQFITEVISYLD
jgi:hypothetical protein